MSALKINIIATETRMTVKMSKREGILNFDDDNAYPQRSRQAVCASGRASTCLNVLARFIMGGGLKDKKLYKTVINDDGLRMDELHRFITGQKGLALHRGFAIHVNYNGLGQIVSLTPIDFEECRIEEDPTTGKAIKIKHNVNWTSEAVKIKDADTTSFDIFNPDPDVVLDQMNAAGGIDQYKGQVFWFSLAGKFKYPLSSIDPVLEDVHSDNESKKGRNANLTTNFLASQMLVTDKFSDEASRKTFKEGLKKFQGVRNVGKIMHVEKETTDQTIELKKIDVQDVDKLFVVTNAEVRSSIRSIFLIPPILVGDETPGKLGPSQQEIQDAVAFFNWITSDLRLIFEETYSKVFQYWHDQTIFANADFSILELSADSGNSNTPLAVTLGVGGTQSMMSCVTDPLMKPEQKINTLVIAFGLSFEKASAMVHGTPYNDPGI